MEHSSGSPVASGDPTNYSYVICFLAPGRHSDLTPFEVWMSYDESRSRLADLTALSRKQSPWDGFTFSLHQTIIKR